MLVPVYHLGYTSAMASRYDLLLPAEYVQRLTRDIESAQRRVYITALIIADDEATCEFIAALERASQRGVEVSIAMDLFFTYIEADQSGSKWRYLRQQVRRMRETKRRLERSGASVRWLGQFGFLIFAWRSHVKWSIVDDTVYSFGGINLYAAGISATDFILHVRDAALADRLALEHQRVIETDSEARGYHSHAFGPDEHRVLVDGGRLLDSIIYQRAVELAGKATRTIYVSQYCPTGKLARLLSRTPTNELYFNHKLRSPLWNITMRVLLALNNVSTMYARPEYLHAKFMLFELPDGQAVAITGSHNFAGIGSTLGTREVALETTDPHILKQLYAFLDSHVRASRA